MVLLWASRAERRTFISKYAECRSASARRTYFGLRLVLFKCHCSVMRFACRGGRWRGKTVRPSCALRKTLPRYFAQHGLIERQLSITISNASGSAIALDNGLSAQR